MAGRPFISAYIKEAALRQGFSFCGIARAEALPDDARRLEQWLNKGQHAGLGYMERYFDLRIDPRKLVTGAKSVITVLKNYFPAQQQRTDAPQVSKYAYSETDYHTVIRKQLNDLLHELRDKFGDIDGRGFVDSAPVLERTWAQKSGLGFIGKNGNLINRHHGSFLFIATLITDLDAEPDDAIARDFCGTCTRCIDACPTDAILPDKVVDANRCISYFTIELKEALIPQDLSGKFSNWMFGCDTCQDVCPWNRFSQAHQEPAFAPLPEVLNFSTAEWDALTQQEFKHIFQDSAISRSKYSGIQRNLHFLQQ